MVNSCVVWGCTNRADKKSVQRHFFDIPRVIYNQGPKTEQLSTERRALWLARINREGYNPDPSKRHHKVCSDHFITGMKADLYDSTNPDWAPSLRLGPATADTGASQANVKRYERVKLRKERKAQHAAAEAIIDFQKQPQSNELPGLDNETNNAPRCSFLLKGSLERPFREQVRDEPSITSQMRDELNRLNLENMALKEKLNKTRISPESLEHDIEKVKHYTGLDYKVLMALFQFLSPSIPETSKSALNKFEKFMLVLMKLRLNLSLQDLGYRFDISPSCASKAFSDIIHIMYMKMKSLILWPERGELQMSMPMEFRKHFGVRVSIVIDCFEVFIERPSNLLARAETWSNYKHHNTVKFLIGITPQGAVSFLSNGWGGRVSDKYIAENCGLLKKLVPGDLVLADRGFNIQESVGLMCAEVKLPAFTKGKTQLSPVELEATRKIAHNRIHVERVIGLVRNKYTILQSTIPVDYLHRRSDTTPTIDKIVTVCCALTNLCESVVPFD